MHKNNTSYIWIYCNKHEVLIITQVYVNQLFMIMDGYLHAVFY